VLEAYKLLSLSSTDGHALHKSCYVAANGFQIIPVTGHKNSCPAASVLTAVSGKYLQLERIVSYFDRVYTPWMQLLFQLDRTQVEALVAPRDDKGEVDSTTFPLLSEGLIMERCAAYTSDRASAGNASDIAMMAFLVNYDGIVIKALHSGDDEGSTAPDKRSLSANSIHIPRIGLGRRDPATPVSAGCKFAAVFHNAAGAKGYAGHYDALQNVPGMTISELPSPDEMRRAAAARLRDLVAVTRESKDPLVINEELITEFEAGPEPLQSEQGPSGKAAPVIELSGSEDEAVDPDIADAERRLAELKAAKAKVKALAAATKLAEAEAAAASAAAKTVAAAPLAAKAPPAPVQGRPAPAKLPSAPSTAASAGMPPAPAKAPSAPAQSPSALAQTSSESAAADGSLEPEAAAGAGGPALSLFTGGASKPVDPERREAVIACALNLLLAEGDDMCKEYVFGLEPGSVVNLEPDSRRAALTSETTGEAVISVVDGILNSNAATQTKNTNRLFKRLAAYTRGHASLSAEREGSVRSGASLEPLSPDAQRALLQSYVPFLVALNPSFTLSAQALVNTGNYIEPAALAVLPPAAAGSQ